MTLYFVAKITIVIFVLSVNNVSQSTPNNNEILYHQNSIIKGNKISANEQVHTLHTSFVKLVVVLIFSISINTSSFRDGGNVNIEMFSSFPDKLERDKRGTSSYSDRKF